MDTAICRGDVVTAIAKQAQRVLTDECAQRVVWSLPDVRPYDGQTRIRFLTSTAPRGQATTYQLVCCVF